MSQSTARVGLIGSGFVSYFHLAALMNVRDVVITAILNRSKAQKQKEHCRENRLGDPIVCSDIVQLAGLVDIVAVFCPNFAKLGVIKAICASGHKPMLVIDKPLARNCQEAAAILELIESAGLKVAYFENQIFMPAITSAKAQLAASEAGMGAPYLARSAEEHGGPHEPWFWDPKQQGGGVALDMMCHSLAIDMHLLTPSGKPPNFLIPKTMFCDMGLRLFNQSKHRQWLLETHGIDYSVAPAEDYAHASITFRNPDSGQLVTGEASDSWAFPAPGLRLSMEAFGPGYNQTVNTLTSPAGIFIGDQVTTGVVNAEVMVEKAQASRGQMPVQAGEPELYGYVHEWRNALAALGAGTNGMLDANYGALMTRLCMAAYRSHEMGLRLDLTDTGVQSELDNYIPLIQQGRGLEVLSIME